ncbi:S-methyl-5-thioribose kinase [Peribacillus frigoritolerans]|uniref:S-methyl-5-thioribose kinase n=1 Tax=Peribacillus frigoritolerans TaxID=450367 RepID=UPI0021A9DC31|nr:S-methyl-5-thioribose kinase [Peribacillus frigoritolerans]MCT4479263.1 S-methyl-5-thioribose kinase [Peribacillus frigoritolerans]
MTNLNYHILSELETMQYIKKIPGLFSENAQLICKEMGDGNLNLVFRIAEQDSSEKSVIIKQALPYARVVGESWPLTLDRSRIESEALMIQNGICPGSVPKVYHYDKLLALTVMEDLSTHIIMRKGLIARNRYPYFAKHIGAFLARTLFLTSDLALDPECKKQKVIQFINPEMCKITEDLVFTDPYYDAKTNQFNPLIKAVVEEIWSHDRLKLEITKLKEGFLTRTQALIHGDFHTGSIMITEKDTKVIDPEFAFYGPMGFDVGAVIANLLLNYCSHEGHTLIQKERIEYQEYLLNTVEEIWTTFEEEFRTLWKEKASGSYVSIQGYEDDYLLRLLQDSFGYAGCEMMRRVVGLAHVPDLESINDPKLRAKGERLALAIGQQLVLERETAGKICDLTSLIKKVRNREVDQD